MMLKLLSGFSISSLVIIALVTVIGVGALNTHRLNNKVDKLNLDVAKAQEKAKQWGDAVIECNQSATLQNNRIVELENETKAAQARAEAAIKNVKPRVVYRQAQIKRSQDKPKTLNTCEEAVARAKLLLKDSPL